MPAKSDKQKKLFQMALACKGDNKPDYCSQKNFTNITDNMTKSEIKEYTVENFIKLRRLSESLGRLNLPITGYVVGVEPLYGGSRNKDNTIVNIGVEIAQRYNSELNNPKVLVLETPSDDLDLFFVIGKRDYDDAYTVIQSLQKQISEIIPNTWMSITGLHFVPESKELLIRDKDGEWYDLQEWKTVSVIQKDIF